MRKTLAIFVVVALALLTIGAARPVAASIAETQFDFHVGDAFLAGFGFPMGVVSRASNGDTITVVGSGHIDTAEMEADGEGTFEHRSSGGALLGSGTWEATELVAFDNFGGQSGLPPDLRGGHAVIQVHVEGHPAANPAVTTEFDATLVVDCEIGNFPAGLSEGITFNAGFINFDVKVSGFTVFVVDLEE